ncbi:hypothetical protein PDJ86_22340 [Bacillus cereus group sp. TH36-2LC]|uniref:hypothetical protein n=1 Tax=Bacillus cereus group sp. TH36-2LC TaxID=3018040 RepID=UPI0022DF51E7|nr:hypothetical protein [Bacillus cereus group sp. TH36-2LC]MDA1509599.1 hypothetical protein [Bacillus cereus group sp. TH36-2LC]
MMEKQNHNVSVRLNDSEFKQLQYLQAKYVKRSVGRVSYADVLRESIKELYIVETQRDKEEEQANTKE